MLLEAMVTKSTMNDLLKGIGTDEIKAVGLCEYDDRRPALTMVTANVSQDRLYQLADAVQATPTVEEFTFQAFDRLVVQSHELSGRTRLETAQTEICYWSYKNEELS